MLALVGGEPKILNLRDMIYNYVLHRKDVVVRRSRFELNKAEGRAHIVEGLLKAHDIIDEIIKTIRSSKTEPYRIVRIQRKTGSGYSRNAPATAHKS